MRFLCAAVIAGFLTTSAGVGAKELVIIANKAYPADRITREVVKEIYLGERTMEKSVRILPVDQVDPVVKKRFVEVMIGTSIQKYEAYWFRKTFRDGVVPPVLRESSPEVIQFLEREVGAIGYVWGDEALKKSGIKMLLSIEVGD
ncbi:MAG: hypothetical protein HY349_01030 [Nitrospirae bacterium]|nr:hypothetical protein [Nitrospirota bacterium]